MGCGYSSRRPKSSTSWSAKDGWITNHNFDRYDYVTHEDRDIHGKIIHSDDAVCIDVCPDMFYSRMEKTVRGLPQENDIFDQKLKLLKKDHLFIDDDFPLIDESLYFDVDRFIGGDLSAFKCKRASKIVKRPLMFADQNLIVCNFVKGELRNDFFLTACSVLAQNTEFIKQLIPDGQILYGSGYKGYVRFRLWRFGEWIDVYIDDYLPIRKDLLIFARSVNPTEFWISFLEKAYAKLSATFESLEYCRFVDVLVDFTGGIVEKYDSDAHTKDLYQILCRASYAGAFLACFLKVRLENHAKESDTIFPPAYVILDLKRITRKRGAECLIKVRNPWGKGAEWKGAWSDNDHRWNLVSEETKAWMRFVRKEDGEYWMALKDFCKHFGDVSVCTVAPILDAKDALDASSSILTIKDDWKAYQTSGGSRNDAYSFAVNPQYLLTVYEPDSGSQQSLVQEEHARNTCSVLLCLMQRFENSSHIATLKLHPIGFALYVTLDPESRLPAEYFLYNREVGTTGPYVNSREVTRRFELEPGYYIFIPSTFNKNVTADFLIRAFCRKRISLQRLADHVGAPPNMRQDSGTDLLPPPIVEPHRSEYITLEHEKSEEYGGAWDPSE